MAAIKLMQLAMLLNLFSNTNTNTNTNTRLDKAPIFPPSCSRIECPSYDVILDDAAHSFQIRRYNSSLWISTFSLSDISLVQATRTGFLLLFGYIQGKNDYSKKIEMTAPVMTQVSPSDGPFCESSFVVSFYVPKDNQADPPPAQGLHVQNWGTTYVAVRQFGGFASDYSIGEEAAALQATIAGSKWADAIEKTRKDDPTSTYIVAQYNSPFEFENRVNEIWFKFDVKDVANMSSTRMN